MKSCDNCIHQDICSTYMTLAEGFTQCNPETIASDCEHFYHSHEPLCETESDVENPYKMSDEWNEYLVNYTKACGEFLILNAKEIVGTYRFVNAIDIRIPIDAGKLDAIPSISISKEFTAPKVDDIIGTFYTKRNERNMGEIDLRLEEKDDD